MPNAVNNESNTAKREPAQPADSSGGGLNIYLIGLVILGLVAMAAYQLFGCSDCYR